jgi:hypothetical protein
MALLDAQNVRVRTGGNIPTEAYLEDMPFGSAKIWLPRIVTWLAHQVFDASAASLILADLWSTRSCDLCLA